MALKPVWFPETCAGQRLRVFIYCLKKDNAKKNSTSRVAVHWKKEYRFGSDDQGQKGA